MQAGVCRLSLFCNPNLSIAENGNENTDAFCVELNSNNTAGLLQKKPYFSHCLLSQFALVSHYKYKSSSNTTHSNFY